MCSFEVLEFNLKSFLVPTLPELIGNLENEERPNQQVQKANATSIKFRCFRSTMTDPQPARLSTVNAHAGNARKGTHFVLFHYNLYLQ